MPYEYIERNFFTLFCYHMTWFTNEYLFKLLKCNFLLLIKQQIYALQKYYPVLLFNMLYVRKYFIHYSTNIRIEVINLMWSLKTVNLCYYWQFKSWLYSDNILIRSLLWLRFIWCQPIPEYLQCVFPGYKDVKLEHQPWSQWYTLCVTARSWKN